MNYAREQIMQALFAQFTPLLTPTSTPTQTQPFLTVSRILPPTPNVPASEQPALYIVEDPEADSQETFGLETYNMVARAVIMGWVPDVNTTIPGQVINPLIDAVDIALRTIPGLPPLQVVGGWAVPANPLSSGAGGQGQQMLGGLVANAWLSKNMKRATGHIGNQNWAVGQIQILTGEFG